LVKQDKLALTVDRRVYSDGMLDGAWQGGVPDLSKFMNATRVRHPFGAKKKHRSSSENRR
jgi:hypothetical protein